MRFTKLILLALTVLMFSCEKEPVVEEQVEDTSPPEIYDARWIDRPSTDLDFGGTIVDGENYTISITGGFQFVIKARDVSNLANGEIYFLVNNDETLRHSVLNKTNVLNSTDYSVGSLYNHFKLSLGDGVFYDYKEGDRVYFYLSFEDVLGYETRMQWTADLIE